MNFSSVEQAKEILFIIQKIYQYLPKDKSLKLFEAIRNTVGLKTFDAFTIVIQNFTKKGFDLKTVSFEIHSCILQFDGPVLGSQMIEFNQT